MCSPEDLEQLKALSGKAYPAQAKWFLNAYWAQHSESAETVWDYTHKIIELDEKNGKEGCEVDEFTAHRFLEQLGEILTVKEMRERMRKIDADFNKKMSLTEYLIFKFDAEINHLVNAPQGNEEAINKAQALLDDANSKLAKATAESETARNAELAATKAAREAAEDEAAAVAAEDSAVAAENEAKAAEADAVAAEDEARTLEAPLKAAEEEVRAAEAELKAQEDAYNNEKSRLEKACEEGGLVSRNRAKNELEQLLGEDPLPLRRAQITTKAALKKAEKARAPFKVARENAEARRASATAAREEAEAKRAEASGKREEATASREEAEARKEEAVAAREAADASKAEAEAAHQAALDYLEEAKAVVPEGAIWWMNRELEEARKYLPSSKQHKW